MINEVGAETNDFPPCLKGIVDDGVFPRFFNFDLAEDENGLVAYGNYLTPAMLKEAYALGLFPWYESGPVQWFSPRKRMIFDFKNFKISKSFQKVLKKHDYLLSVDTAFQETLHHCQNITRKEQRGTWITEEIKKFFLELHHQGLAHSFEVRKKSKLIGGLYGLSLGRAFFGESMFSLETNASKIALHALYFFLKKLEFHFIDCQVSNPHLKSLGAYDLDKKEFLARLRQSNQYETLQKSWQHLFRDHLRNNL